MPPGNFAAKTEYPAALGALAIIVRPPPARAPATKAYCVASVNESTC